MEGVEINYYLKDKQVARRRRLLVPRIGDEVKLKSTLSGLYRVINVVWHEADKPFPGQVYPEPRVGIELEPVKPVRAKKKLPT